MLKTEHVHTLIFRIFSCSYREWLPAMPEQTNHFVKQLTEEEKYLPHRAINSFAFN